MEEQKRKFPKDFKKKVKAGVITLADRGKRTPSSHCEFSKIMNALKFNCKDIPCRLCKLQTSNPKHEKQTSNPKHEKQIAKLFNKYQGSKE